MTLIALAADKGSPGVTTSAVALAAVWPRRALFAECDPHGGDLVYRMPADHGGPLDPNRGLVSLAVEARRGLDPGILPQHSQRLRGGLEILVGLGNADQARGMTGLWPTLGRALDRLGDLPGGADVIADCGRIGPDAPTVDLLGQAGLVLLLARAEAEQIAHVRDRANSLSARLHASQTTAVSLARPPIGIVLIVAPGRAKETVKQVGDLLAATTGGAEVVGVIAYDEAGAAALNGRARGRVDKALLTRSARELAATVSHRYGLLRPQPSQQPGRTPPYQHPYPPQPQPQSQSQPQPAYAASANAETMTSIPITPTSVTPGAAANGSANPNSSNPYSGVPRGGATTAANLKSVPHPSERTGG